MFNSKGQTLRTLENPDLSNISRIAVNAQNHVIITSVDKRQITVFSQNNSHISSIRSQIHSGKHSEHLEFCQPYSIAVNKLTGDTIIGDRFKRLILALSPNGVPKWSWAPSFEGKRKFFPDAICTDNNGYIFIADVCSENIYMLDSSGKFLKNIVSRSNGLNGGPAAIATDCNGHLYVCDEERTVKVFKYGSGDFTLYRRVSMCHNNV
jgi:hypothetical protein